MNALKENMNVPQHIAIIMDGNGRWAKQRNKTRIEGHKRGANQIKKVLDGARKFGVKYITLYAFSSENWKAMKKLSTITKKSPFAKPTKKAKRAIPWVIPILP